MTHHPKAFSLEDLVRLVITGVIFLVIAYYGGVSIMERSQDEQTTRNMESVQNAINWYVEETGACPEHLNQIVPLLPKNVVRTKGIRPPILFQSGLPRNYTAHPTGTIIVCRTGDCMYIICGVGTKRTMIKDRLIEVLTPKSFVTGTDNI